MLHRRCDKNADGRISEEEVKEVRFIYILHACMFWFFVDMVFSIVRGLSQLMHLLSQIIALSASANKLSKLKDQAEEYAALIMEELDPDNLGYIEVMIKLTAKCHEDLNYIERSIDRSRLQRSSSHELERLFRIG
jgi:hypothetical protein